MTIEKQGKNYVCGKETVASTPATIKINLGFQPLWVKVWNPSRNTEMQWNAAVDDGKARVLPEITTGMITDPGLAMGTTPENIATDAFLFNIAGIRYAKAAVAAGTAPHASTIAADGAKKQYGAFGLQIGADGIIDTVSAATTVDKDSEALALAAYDAVAAASGHTKIGCAIVGIDAGAVDWIGATDAFNETWVDSVTYHADDLSGYTQTLGITVLDDDGYVGFSIGTHASIQVAGDEIFWEAGR